MQVGCARASLHLQFPTSPFAPLLPDQRWFPAERAHHRANRQHPHRGPHPPQGNPRRYRVFLAFAKHKLTDTTSYPGATARSYLVTITIFDIHTTGTPLTPRLTTTPDGAGGMNLSLTGERHWVYELAVSQQLKTMHQ